MKKILIFLLGILFLIIENSITNYLDILGVSVNLVIIYITIVSLYTDELEIGIIAALIGIVKDITIGGIFGINALTLFCIAYGISYLRNKIYKESKVTIFALVFITSLCDSMLNIAITSQIYTMYSIKDIIIRGVVIFPLINSIISILLYIVCKDSIMKLKED